MSRIQPPLRVLGLSHCPLALGLQQWPSDCSQPLLLLTQPYSLVPVAAAAAVASIMSDSVRPNRQQPTRLPRPWDSPGKDTGVGCHFLLQCRKLKSESGVAQSCPTLHHPMDSSRPGSSVHGILQARTLEWAAISFSKFQVVQW